MIGSSEPEEVTFYKRRILGISWIIAGVLGALLAIFGLWHWTVGLLVGQCVGLINFLLLCRQSAQLAQATVQTGKKTLILGHWFRFLIVGLAAFLVYRKNPSYFPGFIMGLFLVQISIFVDGFLNRR